MKWTNHSKMDAYGVELVGWPDDVPQQNPSSLTVSQNKLLLDLLIEGRLHFVRTDGAPVPLPGSGSGEDLLRTAEHAIFEESIDYSWTMEVEEGSHISAVSA